MENNRYNRLRDIFLAVSGIAVLAYIIVRIQNVSLSCDENGSYFMFVQHGFIFPDKYDLFSANDHALNTAMMMACEKLFGTSQFSIRLPNLLGAVLYVFSTAMMCRRLRSPLIGVLAFLVLNSNPYMVQYFCVARGYGIAAGFMAVTFWQLWLYFDEGYKTRHIAIATVAGTLAIFANYSYLNLFLPVAGFAGLIALWRPGGGEVPWRTRILQCAIPLLFVLASLAKIIPEGQAIKEAGGFWPTGTEYFWSQAVASVVQCSLYDVTHDENTVQNIVHVIEVFYAIASVIVIAWTIGKWRKGERKLFPFFVFITLTLSAFSVMIQHWMLGTEIVVQRMGLFMVWPFMLLIALAADAPRKATISGSVLALLTGVLLWHFFSTASPDKEAYHPPSENVQDAIDYLREQQQGDARIHLGLDPVIYNHGFEFYHHTLPLPEFDISQDSIMSSLLNEYCFVSVQCQRKLDTTQWHAVKTFSNGNVIYKNVAGVAPVKASWPINKVADTISVLAEGKYFNFGYHWTDTLPDSSRARLRVSMLMKRERFAWGSHWVTVYHAGKETTVQYKSLRDFPASDEWEPVEFEIIIPHLEPGDDIVTATYLEHGERVEVKNYALTIIGY